MSSMDSTSEPGISDEVNEVEIKIEYPEITVDEETETYSSFEIKRRMQHQPILHDPTYNLWTSKATSCLISQYKKYRSMVGQTTQFRSLRDMFETISVEMHKHGFFFSPQKCENKWRVLERKYKNLVMREMMKKPGRMKHYGHWEHKRALDEIFNEKRKSVYLHESEYPPVGGSTKYALILPKPISDQNNSQTTNDTAQKSRKSNERSAHSSGDGLQFIQEELLGSTSSTPNKSEEVQKEVVPMYLEKFLKEMKKYFDTVEKNKERRHVEKMSMRQNELEIQRRLVKIKEQKLELKKRKIIAMAQNIQLNMQ